MGVTGRAITPPLKLTALRQRYEDLNAALAPYAVLDPTYPLISETNVAVGATISTIISDAAVQYIAGQIDEAGLQAAWDDWAAQGGDLITEEFNEAYHAAQN